MFLPNPKEAKHKAWLYRILSRIYDDPALAAAFYFKGGTCAAMRGWLDRYSVDLDFDYIAPLNDMPSLRKRLEKIFAGLGLEIKEKSQNAPQYFLRYPAAPHERNTLKIDAAFPAPTANQYETVIFNEIDRLLTCQTVETMFANKLVALIDRYEQNQSLAGRDVYDIHYFFFQGREYNPAIIIERRKEKPTEFFQKLIEFIEKYLTQTILDQDINPLLPYARFKEIRKTLKPETLLFLTDELRRINMLDNYKNIS